MLSLDNVRIFMRAVELGSFSAAGRALRMSPAVVSYRIDILEQSVGTRLLIRTTRRMSLTESGRVFYEKCLGIAEAVHQAEASVAETGASMHGVLQVTAPLGLGRRLIGPVVSEFRATHPETEFRLRLSDRLLDLVQESIDIAVRMARFEDSSFTLRKIVDVERALVAAPSYLEQHGTPAVPDDLLGHRCLLLRFPGSRQYRWTLSIDGEPATFPVSGPIDADDTELLTQWALAGEGIALKPVFEVAEHLAAGRLVPVLPDFPPQLVALGVLYPTRRMLSPRARAFVDLVVERGRKHVGEALALLGKEAG